MMLRRVFIRLLMAGLSLVVVTGQSKERGKIPPDLLYQFKPIPADENAFTEWLEAEKLLSDIPEGADEAFTDAFSLDGKPATPEQIAKGQEWIATNGPAFNLFEKGLAKEKAQAPRFESHETAPLVGAAKKFVKGRLFQAERAASKGDQTTATNLLLGNLKFTGMLRDSEGPAITYIVARAYRSMSEKALVRWAWHATDDPVLVRRVLKSVPELDDEVPVYEQMLRVEFTEFISVEWDLSTIQKIWIETSRTNEMVFALHPEDMRRALFIVHDPGLLALHPKPVDIEASTQYYGRRFRKYVAHTKQPWKPENHDVLLDEWQRVHDKYVKDLQPLLKATEDEPLPLSKAAAKKAARYYRRIENPVGRHWQSMMDSLTRTFVLVFQSRTERNATRTLLALRVYELEQGKLPESLEDLVKTGLLQKLPMDFFATGPLRYSKDKRIVWSIGEDAIDDGGVAGKPSWMEPDMVWRISESRLK